jgi:hypothetical protein
LEQPPVKTGYKKRVLLLLTSSAEKGKQTSKRTSEQANKQTSEQASQQTST